MQTSGSRNKTKCVARNGQGKFRNQLQERYKNCLVTKADGSECEACHILPYRECQTYDVNNGLWLCANLHKSFDLLYWTIHPDTLKIVNNKKRSCSLKL